MLVCKICGYEHPMMISSSHLKNHNISGPEYKEKFPGSVLRIQSAESKAKIIASKIGKSAWNKGIKTGPNEKLSLALKGKPKLKLRGLKRTAEQRNRISVATKEAMKTAMTDEVRQKLRDSIARRKENGTFIASMLGKKVSESSKEKISASLKNTFLLKSTEIIDVFIQKAKQENLTVLKVENNYWFDFHCHECESKFTFSRQVFRPSTRNGISICPTCYPRNSGISEIEREFCDSIKSFFPDIISNDRILLGGKEIDVYIPSLKIGFEFTGLYWHSEKTSGQPSHLLWKQQYAFNKGITLYTIFEDEWNKSKELVLSRIKAILGMKMATIFARKCKIKIVESKIKKQFLLDNHLQGNDSSSISLGLYYSDELVSLATFKKSNMIKGGRGNEWELSRFCSKMNTRVIGAASKLISEFMQNHNTENLLLISYADRRWSSGKLYETIGFEFAGTSKPSYWYLTDGYSNRVHRSRYMKHRLVKSEEDKMLTEWELAQREGLDRIWDCGTTKWIMKPSQIKKGENYSLPF